MSEHNEFYTTFCQPQFKNLSDKMDDITDLLRGTNGDPGICANLRTLSEVHKQRVSQSKWLFRTFIGAVIAQTIILGREIVQWMTT